jgi:CRP-like cAMP-binding protein
VLPVSKGELATKLLITRETLSRILHKWRQEGIIETQQRRVLLCDESRLRQECRPAAGA